MQGIPYAFFEVPFGIPSWTERLAKLNLLFGEAMRTHSADFMSWQGAPYGYEIDEPGQSNLSQSQDQIVTHSHSLLGFNLVYSSAAGKWCRMLLLANAESMHSMQLDVIVIVVAD